MSIQRTGAADPAYRRLAERQARRGLAIVAALCVGVSGTSLGIQAWRGAPVAAVAFVGLVVAGFALTWLLVARTRRRLGVLPAMLLGFTTIAATVGTELSSPLFQPNVTISFIGLIPIGMAVFAVWDLRAHLAWLSAATVLLVVFILAGSDNAAFSAAAAPLLVGWGTGMVFSTLAQQALERGRVAMYRSARRAHEARAAAATALVQLRAVEAMGRVLSERGPTDETLRAAMRMLVDTFCYAFPSIYLGDERSVRLGAQAGYDAPPDEFDSGTGIIGRVLRTRRAVLLPDVGADSEFIRASPEVRSEICVPLLAGGRILGVLNVESTFALGSDHLASVSIIADRLAAALDLAERHSALERFLEASPLAIVAFGADGPVSYWNQAAAELFGWSADEVLGQPNPIVEPADSVSLAIDREVVAGRIAPVVEVLRHHRDGHDIPVRIFAAPFGERPPFGTIGIYQDLTAERAASAALTESEARFETVVGALREGVVVQDMDLNVLWSNAAAERLLGVSGDQLESRAPWDERWAVIREDGSTVNRDDYPGDLAVRTGRPILGVTMGIRHPSGEVRWLEADAVFLHRAAGEAPYAVVTSLSDVTERKRHEDELAAAELQVRSVLEQAANPIVGVDMDGRVTYANRRAEDVFGWPAGELIGQPVEVLVPDGIADRHADLRDGYVARPTARPMAIGLEPHARRRDGSLLQVEVSMSPVETPAGRQVFATIVDTTERRRVEAELLQAAKMDSIGRLAGGIAHDFNNLLTAIIGYGEIALTDLPAEDSVREEVGEMVKAAERASELTRQLLGFARKSVASPATHDLNGIVAGLTPFLNRLLGERIALVTNLDPATGFVRVDRTQVDQILVNLAVNARDAMPDGGTLVIETSALGADDVDGVLGVDGDRIALLTVSDTGLGMTEETRARVFEPFFTTKPFGEGTGLGLATTWGIVHGSGGAITVDSTPAAGTTFRIYLPQVEPMAKAVEIGVPARFTPGSPRTVLVVEDEESVRALTTSMLERADYHVLQAPNGAAAVSLVGTRLSEVDVLLTDVVMPGMRGPELLEVLRAARPDLPAVFMTGYSAGDAGSLAIPADCTLLPKPFSRDALLAAIGEASR